jgi:RNA 2',3'-cyclic 3'-phosphodiesterase
MRLFVAVELPEPVRAAVDRWIASLESIPGVRWNRDASHVTLRFLGETAPGLVPEMRAALADVSQTRFSATVGSTGQFPERGRARVLWLGFADPEPWRVLANAVDTALGIPADPRPFVPHLTIGRTKRPLRFPSELTEPPILAPFEVDHFTLFESTLGSKALHTPLARFALANVTQSSP